VNTASVAGLYAGPFMGPYNASKYAVVAVSETLHHEMTMGATGVGVSVLCPGWVATQIALSDRNRPEHLRNEATDGELLVGNMRGMLDEFIKQGMPPADVAELVLDAVSNDRFYILTHEASAEAVARRMEAIMAADAPPFVMPT
jgi:NAD(P)-dependent dehydrogenase (short-subunit alcohol dehydrogenase family)